MEAIEKSVIHLPVDVIEQYYEKGDISTQHINDANEVINKVMNDENIIYENHEVSVLIYSLYKLFRILDPPIFHCQIQYHGDQNVLTQIDQSISSMCKENRILFIWLLQHYSVIEQHIYLAHLRYMIQTRLFCGLFQLNIGQNTNDIAVEILEHRLLFQLQIWWAQNRVNAN